MSQQLGFSRSTWNNYERQTSQPSLNDLERISKYFNVKISSILDEDLSAKDNLIFPSQTATLNVKGNLKGNLKGNPISENQEFHEKQEEYKIASKMPLVITLDTAGNENVVMVPVKARAGYLSGYGDPKFIQTLPAYRLPGINNGTYRMFEVQGHSMVPSLYDKDIVICSNVSQLKDIRNDRVHVVVTKTDGIVIKVVLNRIEKDGKLILKSENIKEKETYPPIICNPDDILEIWYAVALISRNFRRSSEHYNRLVDVESRLTILEQKFKKK